MAYYFLENFEKYFLETLVQIESNSRTVKVKIKRKKNKKLQKLIICFGSSRSSRSMSSSGLPKAQSFKMLSQLSLAALSQFLQLELYLNKPVKFWELNVLWVGANLCWAKDWPMKEKEPNWFEMMTEKFIQGNLDRRSIPKWEVWIP